jgi:hypothetical protein
LRLGRRRRLGRWCRRLRKRLQLRLGLELRFGLGHRLGVLALAARPKLGAQARAEAALGGLVMLLFCVFV